MRQGLEVKATEVLGADLEGRLGKCWCALWKVGFIPALGGSRCWG